MTNKYPGYCERCKYKSEYVPINMLSRCDCCNVDIRRNGPTEFVMDTAAFSNIISKYAAIDNSIYVSHRKKPAIPAIKDVIFNPPATIIIWEDKTKTVVKCGEGDIYDPEKGMAMAISRKALGDRGSYYNVFEKWLEKYTPPILEGKTFYTGNAGTLTGFLRLNADNVKIVNAETGEVTKTDICEYDAKEKTVDKNDIEDCTNCRYRDYPVGCEKCANCFHTSDREDNWEPKASDD